MRCQTQESDFHARRVVSCHWSAVVYELDGVEQAIFLAGWAVGHTGIPGRCTSDVKKWPAPPCVAADHCGDVSYDIEGAGQVVFLGG